MFVWRDSGGVALDVCLRCRVLCICVIVVLYSRMLVVVCGGVSV